MDLCLTQGIKTWLVDRFRNPRYNIDYENVLTVMVGMLLLVRQRGQLYLTFLTPDRLACGLFLSRKIKRSQE